MNFKNFLLCKLILVIGMGIGGITAFVYHDRIGLALYGVKSEDVPLVQATLQLQQAGMEFHHAVLQQVARHLSPEERRELAGMIATYAQYIESFLKYELLQSEPNVGTALQLNALLLKTYQAQKYKNTWIKAFKTVLHTFDDSMISQFMGNLTKETERILQASN